jgi:nicotinamidase/pyrazinamidase
VSQANYKSGVALWQVDTQSDFMLSGGKLYVPGAEKRIPNMRRLLHSAASTGIFVISSTDQHAPNDPEFARFPPHCVKGTSGAEIVPELKLANAVHIENAPDAEMPLDLFGFQQVVLEKQTLDVFDNPASDALLKNFPENCEFLVFGVVTEFCVRLAAKGLLDRNSRVALVTDAIETIDRKQGDAALDELARRGARLITTGEALDRIAQPARK